MEDARAHHVKVKYFVTRREAETVLECINNIIADYGLCSVADYYDCIGIIGEASFTDNRIGWIDIHDAKVTKERTGKYNRYKIVMPPIIALY